MPPDSLLKSAHEGETPLLFTDFLPAPFCLFCGDRSERRYMCSKCRPLPLYHVVWGFPLEDKKGAAA